MNLAKALFKVLNITPAAPKPSFTIDCQKHQVHTFTAWKLADDLAMSPTRSGNKVIIHPAGHTPEAQAESLALYFYNLGHEQRLNYILE